MMRAAIRAIWACKTSPMNGSAISIATKIARIFGTNTRVISWICVSAWNSEITTPTASPTSISGLDTITSVQIASRATSSTSEPFIASPCGLRPLASDRHLHDFFVALDHAVAHRDQRVDRDFALRNRGDDIDDVGLAGRQALALRIRVAR